MCVYIYIRALLISFVEGIYDHFVELVEFMITRTPSAQPSWAPLGPCGPLWALVGLSGSLWAPPGPLWAGPCGSPSLVGRALVEPPWPLWARPFWAPWVCGHLGPCGSIPCASLCPLARPLWVPLGPCRSGPCGPPWVLVGQALVGPPWNLMGRALMGHSGI